MNNTNETWKDIPGYEGLYQASNIGNIRSIPRTTIAKDKRVYHLKGVLLSPGEMSGYKNVCLHKDKKGRSHGVHRLIALSFLPNPGSLREVNHKDFNKANNQVENLEWVSHSENQKHLYLYGNSGFRQNVGKRGESNHRSKLSEKTVREIKTLFAEGAKAIDVSRKLSIHISTVANIKSGHTWSHINLNANQKGAVAA